jgi:hypothetical protein
VGCCAAVVAVAIDMLAASRTVCAIGLFTGLTPAVCLNLMICILNNLNTNANDSY